MTEDQMKEAHKHCIYNKEELEKSTVVACFHCISIWGEEDLHPCLVVDYCDGGQTALCPKCGIDSLIGNASGIDLLDEKQCDLAEMCIKYFNETIASRYVDLDPENDDE